VTKFRTYLAYFSRSDVGHTDTTEGQQTRRPFRNS